MLPHTLPLDHAELTLAIAGGKGANLAALTRAGFNVPHGFVVTTRAYRDFVEAAELQALLRGASTSVPDDAFEALSSDIRARFAAHGLPPAIAEAIRAACDTLGASFVAVRSSATAEDLPEMSFAGQQDSYLNVSADHKTVCAAVVRCWSSLWTARAMAYRARHALTGDDLALAVVVQAMIQSEVSGVLFTANPLSGKRSECVIEATLGLGEALVSGLVEPDRYIVDAEQQSLVRTTVGSKAMAIRGNPEGGTTTHPTAGSGEQALPDAAILELSASGRRVAELFGAPQDIEWAWAASTLHLLQSRPITSLYPLPHRRQGAPLQVLISLGAVQGMLDPFTPFGRDVFRRGAARITSLVDRGATPESQQLLIVAGDRLFVNVTGALRNTHLRPVVQRALGMVEPGIARALERAAADAHLVPEVRRLPFSALVTLLPAMSRALGNLCYHLLWPDAGRERIQRSLRAALAQYERECRAATTLDERLALCDRLFGSVVRFGPVLMPGLAVGLGALRVVHQLVAAVPGAQERVLEVTRGLPHNVTTEMDLALWATARAIAADASGAAQVAESDADSLTLLWRARSLGAPAQQALDAFLERFGMRGVAEIDCGRPRWREDPRLLFHTLKSYLQINDPERAPDRVFERGAAAAAATVTFLADGARRAPLGWLRALAVRWSARRVVSLAGLRESPKFTVIRLMGHLRAAMLTSGHELVQAGTLDHAEDLFFLEIDEARALARGESRDWRALVRLRREAFAREQRRRQVPLLLLSDGVAFYAEGPESTAEDVDGLKGTPVSPGVVEGAVRVIRDPHGARLEPGEILVCPGTDPAWTPLFLSAGGLVTEVGGLMTHGSVVAREYGIPAVVGVAHATARLTTGMRVRVDGTRGVVTVCDG